MRNFLLFIFFFTVLSSNAQEINNRSLWWSLVPGVGQISADIQHKRLNDKGNQHWWRAPIYLAGLSTSTYFVIKNQTRMNSRKLEWRKRLSGSENLNPSYGNLNNASLYNQFQSFQTRRNSALFMGVFCYAVSVIDAYASHKIVQKNGMKKVNFDGYYSDLGMQFGMTIIL
jgi:hypothetical protein